MIRPRTQSVDLMPSPATQPRYELRAKRHGAGDLELEVWQLPAPATPQITSPIRLGGLRGRNLELIEHRVLRRLKVTGLSLDLLPLGGLGARRHIGEHIGLCVPRNFIKHFLIAHHRERPRLLMHCTRRVHCSIN